MNDELSAFLHAFRMMREKYVHSFTTGEKDAIKNALSSWFRMLATPIAIDEVDVPSIMGTLALFIHFFQHIHAKNPFLMNFQPSKSSPRDITDSLEHAWNLLLAQCGIMQPPPTILSDAVRRLTEEFIQSSSKVTFSLEVTASTFLEHDVLGFLVQKTLRPRMRKRLAAHFTNLHAVKALLDANNLLHDVLFGRNATRVINDTSHPDEAIEIRTLDPFAGSGRLFFAVGTSNAMYSLLKSSLNQKRRLIFHGIELHPLSAMACLLNLLMLRRHLLREFARLGEMEISIFVQQGDAFELFRTIDHYHYGRKSRQNQSLTAFLQSSKARNEANRASFNTLARMFDVVIMNPPYTRYRTLEPAYRTMLKDLFHQEMNLFDSHAGLHVFSLLLGEKFLRKGGLMLAVLPASILHARYAWSLKQHWLRQHELHLVAAFSSDKAFSDDSEFREVTIMLQKEHVTRTVNFLQLEPSSLEIFRRNTISRSDLEKHWNWLTFFLDPNVQQSFKQLSRSPLIVSALQLGGFRLLRGFEMYGPNFFFLPNSYWEITSETSEELVIRQVNVGKDYSTAKSLIEIESELVIPKRVLGRTLRKPSLYRSFITPPVSHWAFMPSPHDVQLEGVKDYITWGKSLNLPAMAKFGSRWATHIHDQVRVKQPIGRVFIPDKISLTSHSTLVHYLDEEVLASKNFYLFVREHDSRMAPTSSEALLAEKLLAAWMCSSLFLFLNVVQRREIGGSLGRLQIIDYLNNPLLLDVTTLFRRVRAEKRKFFQGWLEKTLDIFDSFRTRSLPPIPRQLDDPIRTELDEQFVTLLRRLGETTIQEVEIKDQLQGMISDFASRDH